MIELGLSRIQRLLARTPFTWRAVHVAGTNGKGSVCAYVSAMLNVYNQSEARRISGCRPLKHGRFTSPHLIDRWDCITVNNETISEEVFRRVEAAVIQRNNTEGIGASEFELLTATAFEIFNQEQIDVGVIEVGMGGRLDATNIIGQYSDLDERDPGGQHIPNFRPPPLVTAVSSIGLDHQAFLGKELRDIARQKAGIFKRNVPAVIAVGNYNIDPKNYEVVKTLINVSTAVATGTVFEARSDMSPYDIWVRMLKLPLQVPDRFDLNEFSKEEWHRFHTPIQPRSPNAAIAIECVVQALTQLRRLDSLTRMQRYQLLISLAEVPKHTVWPGRLQCVEMIAPSGPTVTVLLDGAHNAQSATLLADFVRQEAGSRNVQWLLAASDGKDTEEILSILLQPGDAVSTVEFGPVDGMPWVKPMSSQTIISQVQSFIPHENRVAYGTDLPLALQCSLDAAIINDSLPVIAGSLYLIGDVLRLLRTNK